MLLGLYVWLPVYWSKKWGPPFSGLILICINTVVRMFLIIALIIMLYQPASFYRLAHIRPWSLRETASLILIFKRRLFHKDNPRGSVRNQNRKWAKNSFFFRSFIFLSPLFLIPFPSPFCFSFFPPFSSCPHISATLHPCRRRHCKCHCGEWRRVVIVCAWGGFLLLLGQA